MRFGALVLVLLLAPPSARAQFRVSEAGAGRYRVPPSSRVVNGLVVPSGVKLGQTTLSDAAKLFGNVLLLGQRYSLGSGPVPGGFAYSTNLTGIDDGGSIVQSQKQGGGILGLINVQRYRYRSIVLLVTDRPVDSAGNYEPTEVVRGWSSRSDPIVLKKPDIYYTARHEPRVLIYEFIKHGYSGQSKPVPNSAISPCHHLLGGGLEAFADAECRRSRGQR